MKMEPPTKVIKLEPVPARLPSPDEVITEKDLPLLANIGTVRVSHYLLKVSPNFAKKVVSGTAILFLEWSKPLEKKIILDQCFLTVKRVTLLKTAEEYDVVQNLKEYDNGRGGRKDFYKSNKDYNWLEIEDESVEQLPFSQDKWSLTIQNWKGDSAPAVIRIDYETLPTSPSIHWRPCDGFRYEQASSKCCYTPAPAVNNRGLFPCQEPPSAMATWEVLLECEPEYTPLLTSDEPGELIGNGALSVHYFYCSVPLPMSTFAMVVGKFCFKMELKAPPEILKEIESSESPSTADLPKDPCRHHSNYPCRFRHASSQRQKIIPVRVFCLDPATVPRHWTQFTSLVYSSLVTSSTHFGPHPFSRQDIVLVPKSYPHEGLTSPSMIFLAPNNFYGEEPLFVGRLPHEICHNWFGLLIGSLDWTEEWLSEGFATFCEDVLFPTVFKVYFPNKSAEDVERDQALKILQRFTSLQNELRNTTDTKELHVISTGNGAANCQTVTNGLVPIKQFMSVHYYKGYLLLWHLASLVGQCEFLKFLKAYVWRYHGQLVTSDLFLECYHTHFYELLDPAIVTNLKKEWLQSNQLPEPYNSLDILGDNFSEDGIPPLFLKAVPPLKKVKKLFADLLQETAEVNFKMELEKLSCSELLLFMELILTTLSSESGSSSKRKVLERAYFQYFVTSSVFRDVEQRHNADVVHRWCELIIFFKDKSRIPVVENFLRNNIAMGVYLYGELMITERFAFQKAAKQMYYELESVYDLATKTILREMLF